MVSHHPRPTASQAPSVPDAPASVADRTARVSVAPFLASVWMEQRRLADWLAEFSRERRARRGFVIQYGATKRFGLKRPKRRQERLSPALIARSMLIKWVQNGRCYLCAAEMGGMGYRPKTAPSIEHVWPKGLGGAHDGNILVACNRCNSLKGHRAPTPCELLYLVFVNEMVP